MLRHRGILVVLVLVVLLGVAGAVAIPLFYRPLPDPAAADRDGLLRWLVVRDLSAEPLQTRQVLVRRLEEEFRTGLDWKATADRLDASQRKRLWDNVVVLLEPWFLEKQTRYYELAAAERSAYLDELLGLIAVWRGVDSLRPQPADTLNSPAQQGGLVAALFGQVEQCKRKATPQQRQRISQFLLALQTRWLLRNLQRLAPTSTSTSTSNESPVGSNAAW